MSGPHSQPFMAKEADKYSKQHMGRVVPDPEETEEYSRKLHAQWD